jgi:hypothetical protein
VLYTGNHHVLRYACHRGWLDSGQPRCIAFGGMSVDETIAKEVLCVAQPVAVEAAILASEEETRKQDDVLDAWRRDLEAARYAAQRAQRQYDAADPQERVSALRSHHAIPCYDAGKCEAEGWMNLTEAANTLGVSARTLRLAVERGEIEAEHPLDDGPWIFNRRAIETEAAEQFHARVRGSNRNPAIPTSKQSALGFSTT